MSLQPGFNYKQESERYQHYYRELSRFYQKPITQVSAAVLFTIGTIIFFALFAIKPTLETISELLRKIEDQQVVLDKAEKKAAALNTAQQQLDQAQAYGPVIARAIPATISLQDLLLQIEGLASQTGVPVDSLRLSSVTYPEKYRLNEIDEMQLSLSFKSDYTTGKTFLTGLTKLPRYVSLESLSYQPDDEQKQPADQIGPLTTTVTLKTYVMAGGAQ